MNEAGETVGLVEASRAGEARVLPTSIIRRAAERVISRRASVPRPLLGVRGESISATTLKQLESVGWKQDEAFKLLSKQEGLLLTMVAPNSPAALADLRAGDIILRVNQGSVKNSEDFSFLLNEAGGNASVQFTVLRTESTPREITVKLSEAFNLRRATEMSMNMRRLMNFPGTPARRPGVPDIPSRRELEAQVAGAAPMAASVTPEALAAMKAWKDYSIAAGLDWIILPVDKAERGSNSSSMLLVNSVRPDTSAERLGLRAGDIILSVNGRGLAPSEWAEKFLLLKATSELSINIVRGRERLTLKLDEK